MNCDSGKNGTYLSLATNWDNRLLEVVRKIGIISVRELWGTLNYTPVGSGRGPGPDRLSQRQAQEHIGAARAEGLEFCYLMNAPCSGNIEHTREGKAAVLAHVEWVASAGATGITLTNPFLIALISSHFPGLKIKASVIIECNSVIKIRKYLNMGCSVVNLAFDKNRDFNFLRKVPEELRPHIELLTSDPCLFNCPYRMYHYNQMGHTSRHAGDEEPPELVPWYKLYYPILCCSAQRCESPGEWIKSRWIRPEDLKTYTSLGYNRFKIGARNSDLMKLSMTAKSYHKGYHTGNLLELLSEGYMELPGVGKPARVFIDNKALDGFLEHFISGAVDCDMDCGESCRYCDEIAEKTVSVSSREGMDRYLEELRGLRDRLASDFQK